MQKYVQHNKDERTHFFRKIYLSLYLKGFERVTKGFNCVRGELEAEQNCNRLTPTLMAITAFLSRSPGLLNRGPWGPSLSGTWSSFQYLLSNCLGLWTLTPTAQSGVLRGPLCWVLVLSYLSSYFQLIWGSEPQLLNYLHRCISYCDTSAGVNMQQNDWY